MKGTENAPHSSRLINTRSNICSTTSGSFHLTQPGTRNAREMEWVRDKFQGARPGSRCRCWNMAICTGKSHTQHMILGLTANRPPFLHPHNSQRESRPSEPSDVIVRARDYRWRWSEPVHTAGGRASTPHAPAQTDDTPPPEPQPDAAGLSDCVGTRHVH